MAAPTNHRPAPSVVACITWQSLKPGLSSYYGVQCSTNWTMGQAGTLHTTLRHCLFASYIEVYKSSCTQKEQWFWDSFDYQGCNFIRVTMHQTECVTHISTSGEKSYLVISLTWYLIVVHFKYMTSHFSMPTKMQKEWLTSIMHSKIQHASGKARCLHM